MTPRWLHVGTFVFGGLLSGVQKLHNGSERSSSLKITTIIQKPSILEEKDTSLCAQLNLKGNNFGYKVKNSLAYFAMPKQCTKIELKKTVHTKNTKDN